MAKPIDVSTNFLESLIGQKVTVIFPSTEADLLRAGTLISFDKFTILLKCDHSHKTHLIFKHAIESISEA